MSTTATRPEDRRRSAGDSADWADTQPLLHRSEAFAEDLYAAGEARAGSAEPPAPWARTAAMPLLGLALSTVLGLVGR